MIIIAHMLAGPADVEVERAIDEPTARTFVEALPEDRSAFIADTEKPNWVETAIGPNRGGPWLVSLYNAISGAEPITRFSDRGAAFHRIGLRLIDRVSDREPMKPITTSAEEDRVPNQSERAARTPKWGPEDKITAVAANPKREGSTAHKRYALYAVGSTVGEFVAKGKAELGEEERLLYSAVLYDARKGNITIEKADAA
jgi:hypothetical protein